ncbi:serine hydrolase domain-containing protein [Pedobacter heparinus]|uniref:Beta-lactamase n=1 Tax=Pedobacter heparinus (strain ATCC 13125 / DSM 2366 / CIP 104194 / JCM 7457 / NBRC 12017 / NCIMB 9290 / NRRL B-14731 / HIM 762-3) TaxID=485917 RepID=C6Y110_PEDHD|nr:serine hydrolase domain-containing protein [Pedobacter heparinus]ACU04937.1 beta-lactamase [Pedobacter heparinus DSM 2366]
MKTRLLFLLFLLCSIAGKAQRNYSTVLQSYLNAQEKVHGFGGAVFITKKGKVVLEKAFGQANREGNIPNSIQTKFRIGSITKQFTAAAILQLQETGKLNVGDKLSKYFSDYPKGDSVTLHMLLNHTSGIKDFISIPRISSFSTLSDPRDSVIAAVKKEPYDFSPGTKYNYSNSGYFLLGCIIEKVSGEPYSTYILNNLIKKAGLLNTSVDRSMNIPFSAGAMVSTVEDLYKWNKSLFGGKVISPAMFTMMTTRNLNRYGYGLVVDSLYNRKLIGHSGVIAEFLSYDFIFPDEDTHVIILSNSDTNLAAISSAINAILFDKEVINPYKHVELKVDVKNFERFLGKYQTDIGVFELIIKDNKLFRRTKGGDMELKPESETQLFFSDGSDRQLNFVLDGRNVIKAQIIRDGVVQEVKKIN